MDNPVLIFGAGSLGKTVLDIFNRNGVLVYGFLDDRKELHGKEISEVVVLGDTDDDGFLKIIGQKTEACVAIGNNKVRKKLTEMLKERRHTMPVNAVHDQAFVAETAEIGHGNIIAARATINPFVKIGNHCIVHSNAVIDTDAKLGDFIQVGTGAMINTGVEIGDGTFIGSGVVVVGCIKIGKNASIGAGSVVIENVPDGATVFGNPAKKI